MKLQALKHLTCHAAIVGIAFACFAALKPCIPVKPTPVLPKPEQITTNKPVKWQF
jgi:hypothetical protein